ncbi:MAG: hypothetical protein H2057_04100 [Alphaproteobacteria bacterium]|nr:hypothetical protein [Alphaproteobacteria bacterium]
MLSKDDINPRLLKSCPTFKASYALLDQEEKNLSYIVASHFAHHLLFLYTQGQLEHFSAVGELIETFHNEGDTYVQEVAIIGLLEGIQNVWMNAGVDPDNFAVYLRPQSKKAWQQLNDFWQGKPLAGNE